METEQLLAALLALPDAGFSAWLEENRSLLAVPSVEAAKAKAEEVAGGDLPAALRILDRGAAIADQLGDPMATALIWRGRATVFQQHERYAESLDASGRAVAIYNQYGTPMDVAKARTVEVAVLGCLERFDEAIDLAHWIRPLFVEADFVFGQARLAHALAFIYTMAWHLEDALAEYQLALSLAEQLDRRHDIAWILHNLGLLAYQMDQVALAQSYYHRAFPFFVEFDDAVMIVKTQYNLAQTYLRLGEYEEALAHLERARGTLTQAPEAPDNGYVDLLEAQVHVELHDPALARFLVQRALERFEGLGSQLSAAEALIEMGHLLAAEGRPDRLAEGLACLERAERHLRELGVSLVGARVRLEQAEVLVRLQRTAEAARRAESAGSLFAELHLDLRRAQAQTLVADCCAGTDPERARTLYSAALAVVEDSLPLLAVRCWHGLGRVAMQCGDGASAERVLELGVKLLETMRRSLHGHSHQAGFLEDRQAVMEDLLAAIELQPSSEARTLAWLERFKAASLADLLASQPPDASADEALRDVLAARERCISELDRWLASLDVGRSLTGDGPVQRGAVMVAHDAYHSQKLSALRSQLRELDAQVARRRSPALNWRDGVAIGPRAVHRLVDDTTVLISYYSVGGMLQALTATAVEGDVQIHPLHVTLPEIDTKWLQMRRLVSSPESALPGVQARLSYLWQKLITPLEARLPVGARLLILPHRGLFHVPFAALYDARQGQYLAQRHTLQWAPSATVLASCRQRPAANRRPLLVGYAGDPATGDYLAGVGQELDAIQAHFREADLLSGNHATAGSVIDSMPGRCFVHLAGHAFFNSSNPLESGMPLADGRWLHAADLYLRYGYLGGTLAVLSGCETGRGQATGNDVLGLTSAFLYAGAAAIVTGLWRVDDAATARLMADFYAHLAQGVDAAVALRWAQIALLEDAQYAHPYYWAPFFLTGDSRPMANR